MAPIGSIKRAGTIIVYFHATCKWEWTVRYKVWTSMGVDVIEQVTAGVGSLKSLVPISSRNQCFIQHLLLLLILYLCLSHLLFQSQAYFLVLIEHTWKEPYLLTVLAWFPAEAKQGWGWQVPRWVTSWRKLKLLLEVVLVRWAGGAHPMVSVGPNASIHYTVKIFRMRD